MQRPHFFSWSLSGNVFLSWIAGTVLSLLGIHRKNEQKVDLQTVYYTQDAMKKVVLRKEISCISCICWKSPCAIVG